MLRITLIVADAKVREVVSSEKLAAYLSRGRHPGGGGTNHVPVFERVEALGLQPAIFLGLTDLHSRFPRESPPYPVVWVAPLSHGKAPWGSVVAVPAAATRG